jgi:YHS domain-containing protein
MKKICTLLIAVAACGLSFGQKAKTISCAVMKGDMVEIAEATKDKRFIDYKGRRYFFCCSSCVASFKKSPAKYAKSDSIPLPKKK